MEKNLRVTHNAIDEQLAMFSGEADEQANDTETTHFIPGTLNETFKPTPLTTIELLNVREEATRNGVALPESDEDLQELIRSYHAESLHND